VQAPTTPPRAAFASRADNSDADAFEQPAAKAISFKHPGWEPDEAAAAVSWREYDRERPYKEHRAASEGGSFGLGIPVPIDLSVIIQSQDQSEILAPWGAKQVLITTSAWKGVSSAGATIAFEAEAATAPDANVTLAQHVVSVWKAAGVITASYELCQDCRGLEDVLCGPQRQRFELTATGSGSSVPTRIITAMANQTASPAHVKVTTAGQVVGNDVRAVFAALPARYQANDRRSSSCRRFSRWPRSAGQRVKKACTG